MKKQGTTRHLLNVVAFILVFIFVVELVPVTAAELLRGALGDRPYVNTVENSALDFPAEEAAEASESEAYVLGRTRPCGTSIRSITASRTAPMLQRPMKKLSIT